MRCPYCGAQSDTGALFCGSCGKRLAIPRGTEIQGPAENPRRSQRRGAKAVLVAVICVLVIVFVLLVSAVGWIVLHAGQDAGDPEQGGTDAISVPDGIDVPDATEVVPLPAAEETVPSVPESPETQPPTQPTQPPTQPTQAPARQTESNSEKKSGYVRIGAGELIIRSGPGPDNSEVGRLREGTKVEILEVQRAGVSEWGRIERGWVCMDYIEAGDPPASSSQSVSMQVRVKWDAGELNVRGGPGTSYSQVGRLKAGDIVTISEIETVGGTDWGYISAQGWINMDYVDTDITEIPAQSGGSRFLGNWGDKKGQRCFLSISPGISDTYIIYLHWSSGAAYNTEWSAIGWYDETNDCIRYDSCESWNTISDGNGNFTEEVRYTDGEGRFYFGGDGLYWQENKENMESRCCFEKLS